jgi:hypothetical protein
MGLWQRVKQVPASENAFFFCMVFAFAAGAMLGFLGGLVYAMARIESIRRRQDIEVIKSKTFW